MLRIPRPNPLAVWRRVRLVSTVGAGRLAAAVLALALVTVAAVTLPRFLGGSAPGPARRFDDRRPTPIPHSAVRASGVPGAAEPESARWVTLPGPPSTDAPGGAWGRRILRQALLEMELTEVDRGISRLTEIVESAGGFVAGTETQTDATGTVRATITAYVPPDRFGRALTGLESLGRVTLRRISGQDVSEEFVDLEARTRNFERHESQLLDFMSRAEKVSDLLALENELARVRGEIERLTGRLRFLRARTETATIQVSLVRAPGVASPDEGLARAWERLQAAFRDGWSAAFRLVAAVAVFAAQASPLAVLLLAAWAGYRRWTHRRAAALPPSVPVAP